LWQLEQRNLPGIRLQEKALAMKSSKIARAFLAGLLSVVMIFSAIPNNALVAIAEDLPGGSKTTATDVSATPQTDETSESATAAEEASPTDETAPVALDTSTGDDNSDALGNESNTSYSDNNLESKITSVGANYADGVATGTSSADDNGVTVAPDSEYEAAGTGDLTVTNTYEAPVSLMPQLVSPTSVSLTATKTLDGREFKDGDAFAFDLTDANAPGTSGYAMPADTTATTDATSGTTDTVSFSDIAFTETGTYKFTIKEAVPAGAVDNGDGTWTKDSVTYSTATSTATVTVADDGSGRLSAAVRYDDAGYDGHSFTNTYNPASTTAKLTANKKIDGREFKDGDAFTFNMVGISGDPSGYTMPDRTTATTTATSGTTDSVTFGDITFTKAGTYKFGITEEGAGEIIKGVQYSAGDSTATVTVTDDGTGRLTSTVVYSDDHLGSIYNSGPNTDLGDDHKTFTNTYTTGTVTWTPMTYKTLNGEPLADAQFKWQFYDGGGERYETVYNHADGNVYFNTRTFSLADLDGQTTVTKTYYFKEVNTRLPGITYNDPIVGNGIFKTVTVTLTDNGDGTISVTQSPVSYTNTYNSKGSWTPKATKVLEGGDLKGGEFMFVLKDADGNPVLDADGNPVTATNAADGSVTFAPITYTQEDTKMGTYDPVTKKTTNIPLKNYTIEEVVPTGATQNPDGTQSKDGFTYDGHQASVSVQLVDNRNGKITVKPTYSGGTTFSNTYKASVSAKLQATKTISGRDFHAGDAFTFDLTDANPAGTTGYALPDGLTATTTATSGTTDTVAFGDIAFTKAGTYTFEIKEAAGAAGGVTYSKDTSTATVTVTDNGDGTLSASVGYAGAGDDGHTFTNTYKSSGSWTPSATKTLAGRDLAAGQFRFELKDADGAVLQTVANAADGSVAFAPLAYTQDDAAAGPLTYTIDEVVPSPAAPGYTYAADVSTVTVTLTDNGDGTVTAVPAYAGAGADGHTFANTYAASGSVKLQATKAISGRDFRAGDAFTFDLTDANPAGTTGYAMPDRTTATTTATTGTTDTVAFGDIAFTKAGTYTFNITEAAGAAGGVSYSDATSTATVTVTDNGDGTLSASVSYDTDGNATPHTFTNTYESTGGWTPTATKTLAGRDLAAGQFRFELKDADGAVLQTVANAADGSVAFAPLAYTQDDAAAGPLTYTIDEVVPSPAAPGYTYAADVSTVTVTLTDNGDGTVTAVPAYAGAGADGHTFANTYAASGSVKLQATKAISGRDFRAGDAFTFDLTDANPAGTTGYAMPDRTTATTTATTGTTDTVAFGDITFTKAGTYTFNITEAAGAAGGVSYSDATSTATVTVTDNGDGTLTATVSYDGAATAPVFTNDYAASPTELALIGTKTITGRTFRSGDNFSFSLADANPAGTSGYSMPAALTETVSPTGGSTVDFSFDAIHFTKAGDYSFAITETAGTSAGVARSTVTVTAAVHVVDNGDGTLTALATYSGGDTAAETGRATFTNTYSTGPATVALQATKAISGREFHSGDAFTFDLTDANPAGTTGYAMPAAMTAATTATSGTSQTVNFDDITFTKAGTYSFGITEEVGSAGGVSYSTATSTATVTVTDDGDGMLIPAVSYSGTGDDGHTFANAYAATGSATLQATKSITGRELKDGDAFAFDLTDANPAGTTGYAMPAETTATTTATSGTSQTVDFGAITFSKAGTYTFDIKERVGNAGGMTYSGATSTATVTVTDGGAGTLATSVSYAGAGADGNTFTNDYESAGSWVPEATKVLSGRDLAAGQFTFELRDADGKVTQTATNAADGSVTFDAISYTQADVGKSPLTYTISEVVPEGAADNGDGTFSKGGYTYATAVSTVTVTLTDDGEGSIAVAPAYAGAGTDGHTFANSYAASGSAVLRGTKAMRGRDFKSGDSFTFEVAEGPDNDTTGYVMPEATEVTITPDSQSDADFSFGAITFTKAGTYKFEISEEPGTEGGVAFSRDRSTVTVTADDNGDGTITAAAYYNGAGDDGHTFTNIYRSVGGWVPVAAKTLTGAALEDGEFSFELLDGNGRVLQTKKNAADGSVTFDMVGYTQEDVRYSPFTYTIHEVAGAAGGYTYDDEDVTVTVSLTDDLEGNIVATPVYSKNGASVDRAMFVNTYTPPVPDTYNPPVHETVGGVLPNTGEPISPVNVVMTFALAAFAASLGLRRRRHRRE
jgi:pilin isopeptide linkage protein